MNEQTREQLLHAAARVCIQHGFDCEAFVQLMRSGFDVGIASPEQALACHLSRFLFASLQWECPPLTADTGRRRKAAELSWSCWAELNEQRLRLNRQRPAA